MSLPLLAYRAGLTTRDTFLAELMDSLAVVLVDAVGGDGDGLASARPLILCQTDGAPALAVFSAPQRTAAWVDTYPLYRYALEVKVAWVLLGLPSDHGIVIDPGDDDEVELYAAELGAFRWCLPEADRPGLH